MTVKDLITLLEGFDPSLEVAISVGDVGAEIPNKLNIDSVDMGSPYDDQGYSVLDNSEIPDEYFDDECNYIGPKMLLINTENIYK